MTRRLEQCATYMAGTKTALTYFACAEGLSIQEFRSYAFGRMRAGA